jgi:hypothetical protein
MADRKQFNGRVTFADATDAASASEAGVEFKGGVAVEKKVHTGEKLTVNTGGLTVTAGGITMPAGKLKLGNLSQAQGVLTANIDTGVLNVERKTTPAPHANVTGPTTLLAAQMASGYIQITANATSTVVKMPAKSVILALFGGSGEITVGDTIEYTIANLGTTVNESIVLTVSDDGDGTVPSGQQAKIAANAADGETATVGGTAAGRFATRVTNVDGSSATVRLA